MAISERIYYFRHLRGMTRQQFGSACGFSQSAAAAQITQYECGEREPEVDVLKRMSSVLDVSLQALDVPNMDDEERMMHTLFALEDICGLSAALGAGAMLLYLDPESGAALYDMLCEWKRQAERLKTGEITKRAYDHWRYWYPEPGAGAENADNRILIV